MEINQQVRMTSRNPVADWLAEDDVVLTSRWWKPLSGAAA